MNLNMSCGLRWLGQGLSPVVIAVILSACAQSQVVSPTPVPTVNQSAAPVSNVKSAEQKPSPIAQASPKPAIATFQTQQRKTGFSADGRYFLHLESWRDKGAGIPHAAIQIVDTTTNACVANGCVKTRFSEGQANQNIDTAENDVLQKTQQLRQDLQLTAPVTGSALPELARSRTEDGTETVTVELPNQQPLRLTLRQKQILSSMSGGTAPKDQAAMQLDVTYSGQTRSLGSLNQMQDWKVGYSIREVQQSADGKRIVVLLTAAERAFEGTLGRTMVQSFTL